MFHHPDPLLTNSILHNVDPGTILTIDRHKWQLSLNLSVTDIFICTPAFATFGQFILQLKRFPLSGESLKVHQSSKIGNFGILISSPIFKTPNKAEKLNDYSLFR